MQEKIMRAEAEAEGGWEELQTWLKKRRNNQETEDRTMRAEADNTRQDKTRQATSSTKRRERQRRKGKEEKSTMTNLTWFEESAGNHKKHSSANVEDNL